MKNEQQKHQLTDEEKAVIYSRKKEEYCGRPVNPNPQYDMLKNKYPVEVKEYWKSLPGYLPKK